MRSRNPVYLDEHGLPVVKDPDAACACCGLRFDIDPWPASHDNWDRIGRVCERCCGSVGPCSRGGHGEDKNNG